MINLDYCIKGSSRLYHDGVNCQMIPEGHFQLSFRPVQQHQFEVVRRNPVLTLRFPVSWLENLKSECRQMARFLASAESGRSGSLFTVPAEVSVENRILITDIVADSTNQQLTMAMIRMIILSELSSCNKCQVERRQEQLFSTDPILEAAEWILLHLDEPLSLESLAKKVLINECTLKNAFKKAFGIPVFEFYRKARLEKATCLLRERSVPINQITRALGFDHTSYFSDFYKRQTSFSPSGFRKMMYADGSVSLAVRV